MTGTDIEKLSPYGRFLHHCQKGELAFQRSRSGRALFYPRLVDPDGGDAPPQWEVSRGLGRVYSVTLVHQRDEAPYALALVDLDEGFRMMSRIDGGQPEAVAIGARVEVAFRSLAEGQPALPVFTIAGETA
jgi:uncharacterized OB-fold protein